MSIYFPSFVNEEDSKKQLEEISNYEMQMPSNSFKRDKSLK